MKTKIAVALLFAAVVILSLLPQPGGKVGSHDHGRTDARGMVGP